ncbi:MAG: macro domain-containing protein [Clostridia bacterium]|nr:macro domain-containing protein [Clostridia bacterium]
MSRIEIRKISITELETDAIVNAANEDLLAGGGVCGAIFSAAGYAQLQNACDVIGHCDTGSAVITPGFRAKAKFIIHAVGPVWRGGGHHEPELLVGAYTKALELAVENRCRTIAFPLISAGIYGYPIELAWQIAIDACRAFLDRQGESELDVVFAVLDDRILTIGQEVLERE